MINNNFKVEWMNEKLAQSFEVGRFNPFDFKHVKLCRSLNELHRLQTPSRNKLVLASTPDMECGFSRSLFVEWCENPKNTIILTSKCSRDSLAFKLINLINEQTNKGSSTTISINISKKVKLEGDELDEYHRIEKEKEKEKADRLKKSKELESIDDNSSSSDDETTNKTTSSTINNSTGNINFNRSISRNAQNEIQLSTSSSAKHDLMKPHNRNRFFKHTKKHFPMFPFKEEQLKWDDYGEFIKVEDYVQLNDNHISKESTGDDTKIYDDDGNLILDKIDADPEFLNQIYESQQPTKSITEKVNLTVKAKIIYSDFEGRSDGDSIKKLLLNVKPKNLVNFFSPHSFYYNV